MSWLYRDVRDLYMRIVFHVGALLVVMSGLFCSLSMRLAWIYFVMIVLMGGTALFEMKGLLERKSLCLPWRRLGVIQALFLFGSFFAAIYPATVVYSHILMEGSLLLAFLSLLPLFFDKTEGAIIRIATYLFSFLYVAIPLSSLIKITYFFTLSVFPYYEGVFWVGFAITVVKGGDIFAYLVGKSIGKRVLVQAISPHKTYEGMIAGILASLVLGVVYVWIARISVLSMQNLSWVSIVIITLVLGIFALIGDLFESQLKRDAGVKDSNHIPGVGGMLDTLDSLLFGFPVLYIALNVVMV